MRAARRLVVVVAVLGVTAAWPAAALAGGGGHGGVCFESLPDIPKDTIAVADNCFSPDLLTAGTGETIRWNLVGGSPHTVTFPDGIDSGVLQPGSEVLLRFNAPGTYAYSCALHPGMTGTVEVTGMTVPGDAIEVLDGSGQVTASLAAAPSASTAGPALQRLRIELDPVTAVVLLALGAPLSAAGATRLVRSSRRTGHRYGNRIRWRKPWTVDEATRETDVPEDHIVAVDMEAEPALVGDAPAKTNGLRRAAAAARR